MGTEKQAWTPEPWYVGDCIAPYIKLYHPLVNGQPDPPIEEIATRYCDARGRARATLQRAAACVNFCAGIPTEALTFSLSDRERAVAGLVEAARLVLEQSKNVVQSCLRGCGQAAEEFAYDLAEHDTYRLAAALAAFPPVTGGGA